MKKFRIKAVVEANSKEEALKKVTAEWGHAPKKVIKKVNKQNSKLEDFFSKEGQQLLKANGFTFADNEEGACSRGLLFASPYEVYAFIHSWPQGYNVEIIDLAAKQNILSNEKTYKTVEAAIKVANMESKKFLLQTKAAVEKSLAKLSVAKVTSAVSIYGDKFDAQFENILFTAKSLREALDRFNNLAKKLGGATKASTIQDFVAFYNGYTKKKVINTGKIQFGRELHQYNV